MTRKTARTLAAAVLLILIGHVPAFAGDALRASVSPETGPVPVITQNGNAYSSGTYAIGTIQLLYVVNASQFTPGLFASFDLAMEVGQYKARPVTAYPVPISLEQIGGHEIVLTPTTSSFTANDSAFSDTTLVSISISDDAPNADGTVLVGNLRIGSDNHFDTVTNVQVKVLLVHPDPSACLKFYNFITDQSFTEIVTSTEVNVSAKGKINSLNPLGQLSDDLLVVNTCSADQQFDLGITLDALFQTNPHDNPGNAVSTYSAAGSIDPADSTATVIGTTFEVASGGLQHQQQLCLNNQTVPGGEMLLTTVHVDIDKGTSSSSLPANGEFHFSGTLFTAGQGCTTGAPLSSTIVTPNPATATLTFTIK
jgi:hypothetical protein